MPNRKRQGNDPTRRVAPPSSIAPEVQSNLEQARYTGSAHHKTKPADYEFDPPVNPRPGKSLCDDLRVIRLTEATRLFHSGVRLGMVSSHIQDGLPKYVWSVADDDRETYEAKLGGDGSCYHGYRLPRDARMRDYIIAEWEERTSDQPAD